ncbi:MAG: lasso RiPP family leader peptide-containing protein [Solirubrobacterales bacterium]
MASYESPQVIDLGAFEDLTQKGTGKAQDSSESSGSKV